MPLFKKKVPIKIIKTEPLNKPEEESKPARGTKPAEKPKGRKEEPPLPNIKIDILGKQQLKQSMTADDWREAAQQVQQEISRMTLPEIIIQAREAREHGRLDDAILELHRQQREVSSTPEIEDELKLCMQVLENPTTFQKISNAQLAVILFDGARFAIRDRKGLGGYLESRFTVKCENPDLSIVLDELGMPQSYFCYSLAEFVRPLDIPELGEVQADFVRQAKMVNRALHFVVCQESQNSANWAISDTRLSKQFTTIPLERGEVRQAIINDSAVTYLENKINIWCGSFRLFAKASPVFAQGEFFGRDTFFRDITNRMRTGQSFYVLGNRRMGKTSLILYLQNMGAFSKYLFAFIDLQHYADDKNFDGAINHMVNQWLLSLQKQDRRLEQEISDRLGLELSPTERCKKFIECYHEARIKNQVDIPCLVVFDDANLLFISESMKPDLWTRGARDFIRMLRKQPENIITGITVWDFDTYQRIDDGLSYFSGKGAEIYLSPLTEEECTTMIERIGGIILMRFEKGSTEAIYRETGGHPYWTRLLCDSISSKRSSRYAVLYVNQEMVEKAASEFVSIHPRYRDEVLELLKPVEQKVLSFLGYTSAPISWDDIGQKLALSELELGDALTHLEYYGWVTSLPNKEYILRMHLLNRYYQVRGGPA